MLQRLEGEPDFQVTQWSEAVDKIFPAIVQLHHDVKPATKDSVNPHFKSKYADLSSIDEATKEPLYKNGLAVYQSPFTLGNTAGVESTLLHTSGQFVRGRLALPVSKSDPQAIGSAITYARRYSKAAICGVTTEDDDGHTATQGRPYQDPQRKPQQQPLAQQVAQGSGPPPQRSPDAKDFYDPFPPSEAQIRKMFWEAQRAGKDRAYLDAWIKRNVAKPELKAISKKDAVEIIKHLVDLPQYNPHPGSSDGQYYDHNDGSEGL